MFRQWGSMKAELREVSQGTSLDLWPDDAGVDSRRLDPTSDGQRWNRVREVAFYVCRKSVVLGIVAVLVVMIGEIWARLPATPRGIGYAFDEELGYRYLSNQIASSRVLGLFAVDTPSMAIDENGFRNGAVDWKRPIILALGSSEVVGPGVAEGDIWTAQLARLLRNGSQDHFAVYNAGTAGYGPYHSAVVFRRLLKSHQKPAVVIMRVSLADREFLPLTQDQLREERSKKDTRDLVKQYTLFVPFLFAKARLQVESVSSIFRNQSNDNTAAAAETMWLRNIEYWSAVATLAGEMDISVVFLVSDPYGTVGGQVLFDLFKDRFSDERCQFVWMLDNRSFGLLQENVRERQKRFAEIYTLKHDPHANALQHTIIAEKVFEYVNAMPKECLRQHPWGSKQIR